MNTKHLFLLLLLGSGCAVRAQPLTSLSLVTCERVPPFARTDKRILIAPFEDVRGPEYSRSSADKHIPVLNLFHSSEQFHYPEQAGMLRTRADHHEVVTVGTLGAAMPSLLADTMRRMQFTDNAVAGTVLETQPQDFDYVLMGKLKNTRFHAGQSPLVHVLVGLLGVPYEIVTYDLEYEVTLFDTRNPYVPAFQRTYVLKDRRAVGVYYNHDWAYPMFVRGLERTLPAVVADVSAVVAGARVDMGPPAFRTLGDVR